MEGGGYGGINLGMGKKRAMRREGPSKKLTLPK